MLHSIELPTNGQFMFDAINFIISVNNIFPLIAEKNN